MGSVKEEKEIEECEGITGRCVCVFKVCVLRSRRRTNSVVTRSTKPRETTCQQITAASKGNSVSRTLWCRHRKEETLNV